MIDSLGSWLAQPDFDAIPILAAAGMVEEDGCVTDAAARDLLSERARHFLREVAPTTTVMPIHILDARVAEEFLRLGMAEPGEAGMFRMTQRGIDVMGAGK